MTKLIDKDLCEWLDDDVPLRKPVLRLKAGAPPDVQEKFKVWKKECDERDAAYAEYAKQLTATSPARSAKR